MLSVSIVLYNTNSSQLNTVLDCIIASNCIDKIYLVDNSYTYKLKEYTNYLDLKNMNTFYK